MQVYIWIKDEGHATLELVQRHEDRKFDTQVWRVQNWEGFEAKFYVIYLQIENIYFRIWNFLCIFIYLSILVDIELYRMYWKCY